MSRVRPLEGRHVVVTRGVDKTDGLPSLLEAAGAKVTKVALIAVVAMAEPGEISRAVSRLRGGDGSGPGRPWLVLTSESAVELVSGAVGSSGLAGVAVAVVGPATAEALRARGVEADLVASGQVAESLATELAALGVDGVRILVVAASGGRNVVAPVLSARGARVERVEAYRTVMPAGAAERLTEVFAASTVDAIIFTSGSTVRHAAVALPDPPAGCAAVCIGPVTAAAARGAGWRTVVAAVEHTAAGVVAATLEHLAAAHPLP